MKLIYECVKANNYDFDIDGFVEELNKIGAQRYPIILGCTEIPIAFKQFGIDCFHTINPGSILAKKAIKLAGYQIKEGENLL